ncbi:MAG: hydrogenase expression protein HypE [Gammaproteobacteria bacterium SG8_11]|nr:MAG: hydrogenase expression protein HypE [Gammaproteobacteria bacterium SG8_11]
MGHFLISAAHKSSGKTTISIGLCAALRNKNYNVQAFKKGPDYIDPMWLGKATGRPCYNLDFYTMERQEILQRFALKAQSAQISLIEGNKGLYDGLDLDGSNSNAALAQLLQAPVVLVIDAQGMTRGIAPLILGYQAFESNLNIAGVILNKLGGGRHESKLRAVIEHYTDVPVIGAVHRNAELKILERHLGLIPSNEVSEAENHIKVVGDLIARQVDLDKLVTIANTASPPLVETPATNTAVVSPDIRIGIAMDAAFGFYYPDDMEAFTKAGAELIPINTLQDTTLPPIDGLFIGGGFPETHMPQLSGNKSLRQAIANAIEQDLPVYAECGGLMYLSRSISWGDKKYYMVGAIAADTVMHEKPQGRGYVQLQETEHHPWSRQSSSHSLPGHEFHYSRLENLSTNVKFAYTVRRGAGVNGKFDGILYKNLLANYSHLRNVKNNQWVHRFVDFVRNHKVTNRVTTQVCN